MQVATLHTARLTLLAPGAETTMNDTNEAARALVARLGGVKTARRRFSDGIERDLFRISRGTA